MEINIIYPADPVGTIPGGIDTFIKGILKYHPGIFRIKIFGIVSEGNSDVYQVGKLHQIRTSTGIDFGFFPVMLDKQSAVRKKLPLSLRFTIALYKHKKQVTGDILEFHRVEPSVIFYLDARFKSLFVHQDFLSVSSTSSDIAWSKFKSVFSYFDIFLCKKMNVIQCVRKSMVDYYRSKLSSVEVNFCPTWYDPELFSPNESAENNLSVKPISQRTSNFCFVGRFDHQKDPMFLLSVFHKFIQFNPSAVLNLIGGGVLEEKMVDYIGKNGLASNVRLLGVLPSSQICEILRQCDLFLLTSNYEGMPICVLEALACGIPVYSTEVGEVPAIISNENGLVVEKELNKFVSALCHFDANNFDKSVVMRTVAEFQPGFIVRTIHERYMKHYGKN